MKCWILYNLYLKSTKYLPMNTACRNFHRISRKLWVQKLNIKSQYFIAHNIFTKNIWNIVCLLFFICSFRIVLFNDFRVLSQSLRTNVLSLTVEKQPTHWRWQLKISAEALSWALAAIRASATLTINDPAVAWAFVSSYSPAEIHNWIGLTLNAKQILDK